MNPLILGPTLLIMKVESTVQRNFQLKMFDFFNHEKLSILEFTVI